MGDSGSLLQIVALLLSLGVGLAGAACGGELCKPLDIMAFNIQIFGQSKASKEDVMGNLSIVRLLLPLPCCR